jgi:hypothetical protein
MTTPDDVLRANTMSLEQIRALSQLTPDVLDVAIDADWTGSALLAHIAFWDRLLVARWALSTDRGETLPVSFGRDLTDLINGALLPEWRALPAATALELAIGSAAAIDAVVAGLDPDRIAAALDANQPRLVDRSQHRIEHLAALEDSLNGPAS